MKKIGVLHPGEMGVSIAASAINSGHQVYWVSTGRSEKTFQRANQHNLIAIQSLAGLCEICEVIISICPPHAAEEVAELLSRENFNGIYLDANAISPQRAMRLGRVLQENNIRFVDGSIIGGPAWKPGETWLYLSGTEANIIGDEIGKASALKMCYAAYSKGTTALLASILATAESVGIREELYQQWNRDEQGFSEQVNRRVVRATAKAWRFEGEMQEIASTFREAGLPGGFHEAAAEVYQRMANLKNSMESRMDQILAAITKR